MPVRYPPRCYLALAPLLDGLYAPPLVFEAELLVTAILALLLRSGNAPYHREGFRDRGKGTVNHPSPARGLLRGTGGAGGVGHPRPRGGEVASPARACPRQPAHGPRVGRGARPGADAVAGRRSV